VILTDQYGNVEYSDQEDPLPDHFRWGRSLYELEQLNADSPDPDRWLHYREVRDKDVPARQIHDTTRSFRLSDWQ
jgi:hypothetical protein